MKDVGGVLRAERVDLEAERLELRARGAALVVLPPDHEIGMQRDDGFDARVDSAADRGHLRDVGRDVVARASNDERRGAQGDDGLGRARDERDDAARGTGEMDGVAGSSTRRMAALLVSCGCVVHASASRGRRAENGERGTASGERRAEHVKTQIPSWRWSRAGTGDGLAGVSYASAGGVRPRAPPSRGCVRVVNGPVS